MRNLGRVLAVVVMVVAGLSTVLFTAVAIDNDGDSDLIVGGVFLAVFSVLAGVCAWLVHRLLRERGGAVASEGGAEQLLARAQAGEAVELRDGSARLRISPDGLLVKRGLGTDRYAWADAGPFRVVEVAGGLSTSRSVGFGAGDATLPSDFGVDPERLAAALNAVRNRHATAGFPAGA